MPRKGPSKNPPALSKERVLHATHQQLADELGSVREIVSRTLKMFAARQWIVLGRARIEIVDAAGLQRAAASEPGPDAGHRHDGRYSGSAP